MEISIKKHGYVLNYLNIEAPRLISEVSEGQPVVLVDHNEFSQSADGIEKAKIETVVDHHRIANFQTSDHFIIEQNQLVVRLLFFIRNLKKKIWKLRKKKLF